MFRTGYFLLYIFYDRIYSQFHQRNVQTIPYLHPSAGRGLDLCFIYHSFKVTHIFIRDHEHKLYF